MYATEESLSTSTATLTFPEAVQETLPAIKATEKPAEKPTVSQSFLKDLVGFLRSKAA
ncbi:hypothetical protein Aazo_0241 ['Nostoc azollae' 0708]|uniref:Uncharacterized protein n=2 Tax=Trichormus azollae TaxID=1164 RepID=D7DYN0_NOSA0|nr:hypothetical protein Aazo_0241 ['Nostoc azollae' 0708]